jgi:hypothetical protein
VDQEKTINMKSMAGKMMVSPEKEIVIMTAALTTGEMTVISDQIAACETASEMNLTGVVNQAEGRMNAKGMVAGIIFRGLGF